MVSLRYEQNLINEIVKLVTHYAPQDIVGPFAKAMNHSSNDVKVTFHSVTSSILQFHLPGAGSNDDLSPGQVEGDLAAPGAFETGFDLPRQRNHGEELHGQVLQVCDTVTVIVANVIMTHCEANINLFLSVRLHLLMCST